MLARLLAAALTACVGRTPGTLGGHPARGEDARHLGRTPGGIQATTIVREAFVKQKENPPEGGFSYFVAGAGFEPTTSGL